MGFLLLDESLGVSFSKHFLFFFFFPVPLRQRGELICMKSSTIYLIPDLFRILFYSRVVVNSPCQLPLPLLFPCGRRPPLCFPLSTNLCNSNSFGAVLSPTHLERSGIVLGFFKRFLLVKFKIACFCFRF